MPNRAQRRKTIKRDPNRGATMEQIQRRWYKQGIGPKDLESEFKNGFNQGFEQGSHGITATCYAAFCLALQDIGFSREQIKNTLRAADDYICNSLTSLEIRDEVFKRLGLTLDFKEAFSEDRVREAG